MKKYLVLILILVFIFSGCTEEKVTQAPDIAQTPQITPDNSFNTIGCVFGMVSEIDINCQEPYVDIQWKNLYNKAVSVDQKGKLYKRLGKQWVDIGEVTKLNAYSDYITIDANSELEPIRYSLKDLGQYSEGRYLVRFLGKNPNEKIKAEAEIYITEKEVLVTPTPSPRPEPTPTVNYIGTDACPAKKETFSMYKNIIVSNTDTVEIELIELTYCRVPEFEPIAVAPDRWIVRIFNKGETDIILKSAQLYHKEMGDSVNTIGSINETRIKAGQAGDISVRDFYNLAKSGRYVITVMYENLYGEEEAVTINMELPEKYAGKKFPVSLKALPTDPPGTTGKPVIYLYPEKDTEVTVKLTYDGLLKYTYPKYNNGWHVLAKKDGTIINYDDNMEYSYLFWEGYDDLNCDFSKGFCIKGEDTAKFLQKTLAEIGLTPKEYNEFIVYWLPQMQDNPYNIISFQYENYCEMAKLEIAPQPDSLLRVFMAFKPSESFVEIEPQKISTFQRNGFTVVEWGGKQAE